jgi:hypothetical protein
MKILPPAWNQLNPHLTQYKLWTCSKRFPVVAAGRGSGKTELALRRLALCSRVNKSRYFYAGPTIQQAKSVAWDRLIELIPPQWLAKNGINNSELKIKTIFGSEIRVVGMDKPQRIEGVQYNGGVIDETADIKPGSFNKSILPALSHHRGWCWRIGVPKRTGVGVLEYKEAFDKGLLEGRSFTWPSEDILPPDIIEEARNEVDEITFNEQFRATWETTAGGIYYAFNESENVETCEYDPSKPICVGSDFNVDPMSWCLSHKYKDQIRTFDEVRLRDSNTPLTLDHLFQKYGEHRGGWIFHGDAAGRNRSTISSDSDYIIIRDDSRFLNKKILYPRKNPRLKDRFASTNAMFKNANGVRRAFIDPKCRYLIDDLKCRSYKEGTSDPDDGAGIGHMADAFDYVIYANFKIGWEKLTKHAPKVGLAG